MAINRSSLIAVLTCLFVVAVLTTTGGQNSPPTAFDRSNVLPARAADKSKGPNDEASSVSEFPDDKYQRLLHFVQITDIHVSMYSGEERLKDFKEFLQETLMQIIKPPVVVMTGDIIDALGSHYMESNQNLEEWKTYRKAIEDSKILDQLQWLDIRGNHDNLNLRGADSSNNLYGKYSIKGALFNHSYKYVHQMGNQKVAFIMIDTCMDPGLRRPFNFFGRVTQERYDEIVRLQSETKDCNYTLYFGHQPTSVVLSQASQGEFVDIFSKSGPYMCGHYHSVSDLAPRLWNYYSDKDVLELELADFKKNRMFRVISVDNGLLNFVDVKLRNYPIILVTNPKNALFHLPYYEPIEKISKSTHIRVLVFSADPIMEVKVTLDNVDEQLMSQVDKTPLFILPWKPELYSHGLHRIKVVAEDTNGRSAEQSFYFSLDGSRPKFALIARIILSINRLTFSLLIGTLLAFSAMPIILVRARFSSKIGCYLSKERSKSCLSRITFQMALLSSVDRLFYPLILYPCCVVFGPWFIGYLVEDHIGICFMWGSFVNGQFVPGGMSFFYGFILLLFYYIPLCVILSTIVHQTYARHFHTNQYYATTTSARCTTIFMCLLLIAINILWASWFWFAYGYLAIILGIVPTGSLTFTIIMWRIASVIPRNCFCINKDLSTPSQESTERTASRLMLANDEDEHAVGIPEVRYHDD